MSHDKSQFVTIGNQFINLANVCHGSVNDAGVLKLDFAGTVVEVSGKDAEAVIDHLGGCCHDLDPSVEKLEKAEAKAAEKAEKEKELAAAKAAKGKNKGG